jgi:hypothetical protein
MPSFKRESSASIKLRAGNGASGMRPLRSLVVSMLALILLRTSVSELPGFWTVQRQREPKNCSSRDQEFQGGGEATILIQIRDLILGERSMVCGCAIRWKRAKSFVNDGRNERRSSFIYFPICRPFTCTSPSRAIYLTIWCRKIGLSAAPSIQSLPTMPILARFPNRL